jgi:hypothetical protein
MRSERFMRAGFVFGNWAWLKVRHCQCLTSMTKHGLTLVDCLAKCWGRMQLCELRKLPNDRFSERWTWDSRRELLCVLCVLCVVVLFPVVEGGMPWPGPARMSGHDCLPGPQTVCCMQPPEASQLRRGGRLTLELTHSIGRIERIDSVRQVGTKSSGLYSATSAPAKASD